MTRRTIYFSGHVQGVGFRFATRQLAAGFAVKGFVRNLKDGRVQMVVEADPNEISALLERIRDKMQGYVEQVEIEQGEAVGEFQAFEIRR